jgi:hypothetical protein
MSTSASIENRPNLPCTGSRVTERIQVAISRLVKVDIAVYHCRYLSSTPANVEGNAARVELGIVLLPLESQARNKTNIEKQQ